MKDMLRRNWFWIVGLVVVLAGGLLWFGMTTGSGQEDTLGEAGTTVTVVLGDLAAGATATGRLQAQRRASLALQVSGTVDEVMVVVGERVAAGDVLLTLERLPLERAVLDAEQALLIQEQQLAELLAPATAAELAAAEASVASAEAHLERLLNGATAEQLAAAEASLRAAEADVAAAAARLENARSGATSDALLAAENALAAAEEGYTAAEEAHRATYDCTWNEQTQQFDCVGGSDREEAARVPAQQAYADLLAAQERLAELRPGGDESAITSAQAGLTAAAARRDSARASLELLREEASTADLAAAEADLARAQNQLDALRDGPDEEEQIARQEALVEQARISLARAQLNLERGTLVAPFAGVVSRVEVAAGEAASGIVVELIDSGSLAVVLEVDEIDIGDIAVGQPAVITLESWPETEIAGEVAAVAPENSPNSSGTIVYEVRLDLGESEIPLRDGLTADARLTTAQRQEVLLLPNAAIDVDRQSGAYSVDLVTGRGDDGTLLVETVPVTIGLRDEMNTQITGGLAAGDEVAIGYNPPPVAELGPPGSEQR